MPETTEQQDPSRSILCAVLDEGKIALVRVLGRGNFSNSMPLKRFASHVMALRATGQKFVVDLHHCETMDSTFMGVMAGVCISLRQKDGGRVILVNVNDHCRRLLKNLGLMHLLEIRDSCDEVFNCSEAEFKSVIGEETDKVDQICLTLQAHKNLIKVDGANEVRFQAVIEYLEKALQDEGGTCAQ